MTKKLRYRIAVHYESSIFIEADSAEEAIQIWQEEMKLQDIPYRVKEEEWIKGGFRLVLELQEHLSQADRDNLGESITIENIDKAGQSVK
jgi:hypothetical protein